MREEVSICPRDSCEFASLSHCGPGEGCLNIKAVGEELIAAYGELKRFLVRRLSNADDAADVAQTSFERVYARALVASVISPRALLFHTARNICIDRARHQTLVRSFLEERRMDLEREACTPSVEELVVQRETLERVFRCLQAMPARRREVFLLFRAYGYTRTEISARLRITEAAVAKHVVRATVECARTLSELRRR